MSRAGEIIDELCTLDHQVQQLSDALRAAHQRGVAVTRKSEDGRIVIVPCQACDYELTYPYPAAAPTADELDERYAAAGHADNIVREALA